MKYLTTQRKFTSCWLLVACLILTSLAGRPILAHEIEHHADEPEHWDSATTDVIALVRQFRQTGNDEFLDRAWKIVEPQLVAEPRNARLLIEAATIAQARHDFDRAVKLVKRSIALQPGNSQSWLLLASIHLVRGDSAAAGEACNRLRQVPVLVSSTCHARVALSSGNAVQAYAAFTKLLEIPAFAGQDDELRAWSLSVAGDLARAVDESARAIDFYTRSLEWMENTQVRSALVDVLIDQGELESASDIIRAGTSALPLEIRRMLVARRLGQDVTRDIHHTDHEFRHWIARNDWLHAREMARFYLDVLERPELAQRLATINVALQREPEDLLLASRVGE